jgi:flagellar export protein FliJ
MDPVEPKTRLDRLVQVRERGEDAALRSLATAQTTLGRVTELLASRKEEARTDGRGRSGAADWMAEEAAHLRALQDVRNAERALAQALTEEQRAKSGYLDAHQRAEAVRRAQEKKRTEIKTDRSTREARALDELATLRFNVRASH